MYEQRFRHFYERSSAGKNAANLDWLTEMYQRDTYDEFWRSKSFLAARTRSSIPTLHGGVWYDHFIRGTLSSHAAIDVPKRLFVGPGSLITRFDLGDGGFGALMIAWFDHFLRGADNGVLDEPAGPHLQARPRGVRRRAAMAGADGATRSLYLAAGPSGSAPSLNDGVLADAPPEGRHQPATSSCTTRPDPRPHGTRTSPISDRSRARCLTFTTPPLDADVEIVGRHPPRRSTRPPTRPTSTSASGSATCSPTADPACSIRAP